MDISALSKVEEDANTSNNKPPSSDPSESQLTKKVATVANNVLSNSKYKKFKNLPTPSITDKDALRNELIDIHYQNTRIFNPNIPEDIARQMAIDSVTPDVIEQVRNDEIISKFYQKIVRFDRKISDTKAMTIANSKAIDLKVTAHIVEANLELPIIRNGLTNFNDSCYINTCIQLLATIEPIVECLRNGNRESTLKEPLFALIDALKDPMTPDETTKKMVKDFRNLLLANDHWIRVCRGDPTGPKDAIDLLDFLEDEFGAHLPNVTTFLPPDTLEIVLADNNSNLENYLQSNVNYEFSFFIAPISNPNSWFDPPHEVTLGEDTFRLSGVVRRPRGNHFVFFQPSANNELGVTYDDHETKVERDVSEARAVVYTKVV